MKTLLFRPIPYPDESAASLLIRAASENGHNTVQQLLSGSGIIINEPSLRAVLLDAQRYKHIVTHLGLGHHAGGVALERSGISRRSPRRYREVDLPDGCFRRDDARAFCAQCLQDASYWRKQWLVRPLSACLRHSCLLSDRCPACKKVPSVGRGTLTVCNHCQTSLLQSSGVPKDTAAISTVDEMFASQDAEGLRRVFDFWVALSIFDGLDSAPATDYERLILALTFLRDVEAAANHIAHKVVERLPMLGPRVQLLPFLSSSSELRVFAEGVESAIWPLTQIGEAESRLPHLSKSEVCIILKMSPAKLTQLITAGHINWPLGGRQKKIEITERELRMQGFSQTEILSLYPEASGPVHRHDRTRRVPRTSR